jgi:putative transposase
MRAAQRFLRSGRSDAGLWPDRVTTDGHNFYPRAIRSTPGRNFRHRMSAYLNNRLKQDHRGIKGRIRCMRGFKEHAALATTSTFQQPADAVAFFTAPASL